jgi:uncharacterized protein (DUF302 family)
MEDYGRRISLDIPFEQAVAQTSRALHAEGFDVIATIDVRDYLARNAHHDCRRYVLLQALLPQVTLDALQHDIGIGPMLPTAIAIFELPDGETAVAASPALAPVAFDFGWRAGQPAIAAIADRSAERLAHALARLQVHQHDSAAMVVA